MYLNGIEVDNHTGPFNTSTSLSSHTGTPCIGDSDGDGWDEGQVTGNFDGRIQDMIYWGDESPLLTGSDFADIYNAGMTTGIPWIEWSDASNPDESSPWSWDFNFPNGTGYYQFYSMAQREIPEETEIAPNEADAICNYTASGAEWNLSFEIAWRVINITDITILNLSTNGNISIAGSFFESSSLPANVAVNINNSFWLTVNGDLHISGTLTTVSAPVWKVENITNVDILKLSNSGDLEIRGSIFEDI